MTSAISSVKLWKQSVKQNGAAQVLLMLFYFCILPLPVLMMISKEGQMGREAILLKEQVGEYICYNDGMHLAAMAAGVLLGILLFAFLHSAEKMDFYQSHAVKRERFFLIRFLAGISVWLCAFLVNLLLTIAIVGVKGYLTGSLLRRIAEMVILETTVFLVMYSLMVLAMVLTGKIFTAVLGMLVFCAYIPATCLSIFGLCEIYLHTCVIEELNVMRLSPALACIDLLRDFISPNRTVKNLLPALFLTALVVTIIALCFYRKRGSEAAGRSMAFEGPARIIKFLLVVPVSLGGELFFYTLGGSDRAGVQMAWGIFGFVFTFILINALIEFIYHMDLRELFRDRKQIVLTALVSTVILVFFMADLSGYDKWMPKEEDVQAIVLNPGDFSTSYSGEYTLMTNENGDPEYYQKSYYFEGSYETEDIVDIYQFIAHSMRNERNEDGDWNQSYRVTWKMKDGTEKTRKYYCDETIKESWFTPIEEREDFRKAMVPALALSGDEILDLRMDEMAGENDETISEWNRNLTSEQKNELFETMKKEFLAMDQADLQTGGQSLMVVIYRKPTGEIYGDSVWLNKHLPETEKLLEKYGYPVTIE